MVREGKRGKVTEACGASGGAPSVIIQKMVPPQSSDKKRSLQAEKDIPSRILPESNTICANLCRVNETRPEYRLRSNCFRHINQGHMQYPRQIIKKVMFLFHTQRTVASSSLYRH